MGAALITGGSKRLGAAIAEHLASQGRNVVIHAFSSGDEAKALAVRLANEYSVKTGVVTCDLRDRDAREKLIGDAVEEIGGSLDLLVNNASVMSFDRVDEPKPNRYESWDENFHTNLEAPYFLAQDFAAQCTGEGVVINMIDQRVWRLTPNYGSYTLAKSALYTFTKTAAMALAPNIRVNGIGPGTTLQGAHQSRENFEHHRKISILERGADVEDILQAVDYLISARNVTGQMIAVDGGQHMIWQLP